MSFKIVIVSKKSSPKTWAIRSTPYSALRNSGNFRKTKKVFIGSSGAVCYPREFLPQAPKIFYSPLFKPPLCSGNCLGLGNERTAVRYSTEEPLVFVRKSVRNLKSHSIPAKSLARKRVCSG